MNGTMWCSHSEANGMSRTITISSCSAAKVTSRWSAGFSSNPANSSAYMRATRPGVLTSPSRCGSSPTAERISVTAASIRSMSTLIVLSPLHSSVARSSGSGHPFYRAGLSNGPASNGPTRAVPLPFGRAPSEARSVIGMDGRQVPVPLRHVEPVADHEVGRDGEAHVPQVEGRPLLALLHQEGAHLEAGRLAGPQVALQVAEGEAAVDDVLDHQHMAVEEVEVEVLHDAHHARGPGGAPVGRDGHEVDLAGQGDGLGEVAHEHEGALQHPDQQWRSPLVVGSDGRTELGDTGPEVRLRHDHPTHLVAVGEARGVGGTVDARVSHAMTVLERRDPRSSAGTGARASGPPAPRPGPRWPGSRVAPRRARGRRRPPGAGRDRPRPATPAPPGAPGPEGRRPARRRRSGRGGRPPSR